MISYDDDSVYSTKSLEEAIKYSEENAKFEKVPLLKKHFRLDKDGVLKIQEKEFKITQGGIQNLCSTLGIPDPFAEMIPTDLFITNVNRLIDEEPMGRVNAYFDPEERLIDFNSKINLQAIGTDVLLKEIARTNFASDCRVMFENHRVKIEVIPETQKELIETKGEIHKTGFMLQHYPTAKSVSQALGLIWTVACTNGSVVSREIWREKINLKSTSNSEVVIQKFFEKLKTSSFLSPEHIQRKIMELKESNFLLGDFEKLFNSTKRILGDDVIPALTEDAVVKFLENKNKELEPELELDINKYKVYYSLTDFASNVTKSASISRKLQLKAGNLLFEK